MIFPTALLVMISSIMHDATAAAIPLPEAAICGGFANAVCTSGYECIRSIPSASTGICRPKGIKLLISSRLSSPYNVPITIDYSFGEFDRTVSEVTFTNSLNTVILDQNKAIGTSTSVNVDFKLGTSANWKNYEFNAICDNTQRSENILGPRSKMAPILFKYRCVTALTVLK